MKRIITIAALIIAAFAAVSCLYEEKSDVAISISVSTSNFSYSGPGNISEILAMASEDPAAVKAAFVEAFNASGLEILGENNWVMRGQMSNKSAEKKAKEAAEKANAKLSSFKPSYYDYVKASVKVDSSFGKTEVASYTYSK